MNRLSLWQNALVIPLQRTTGAPPPPAPMALQGVTVAPKLCPSPWIQGTPLLNRFWTTMPLVASTDCVHTRSQTHAACTWHRGPSHGGAARAYDKLHPHALRALHYQATSSPLEQLPSSLLATIKQLPSLLWPLPSHHQASFGHLQAPFRHYQATFRHYHAPFGHYQVTTKPFFSHYQAMFGNYQSRSRREGIATCVERAVAGHARSRMFDGKWQARGARVFFVSAN